MSERTMMNGKPVIEIDAKTIINFKSGFGHKLLCDSLTFSTGTACAYSCSFCYVPAMMAKSPHLQGIAEKHEEVVIRRRDPISILEHQLLDQKGRPKFKKDGDNRVIYASPLVDVAANMDLVKETIAVCLKILELTNWQIRLLSKSNLLSKIADGIPDIDRHRIIYGVSTGTLDDNLARAFEEGTPLVSKRLACLHEIQDRRLRTFGMVCPSLPQLHYGNFALDMREAIRADKCEHVWAEVLNARGDSMRRTVEALEEAGASWQARQLAEISTDAEAWEKYSRDTFEGHVAVYGHHQTKLRFLQYVNDKNRAWWEPMKEAGAVLL